MEYFLFAATVSSQQSPWKPDAFMNDSCESVILSSKDHSVAKIMLLLLRTESLQKSFRFSEFGPPPASGGSEYEASVTGTQIRDSQTDNLSALKTLCDCQATYFLSVAPEVLLSLSK